MAKKNAGVNCCLATVPNTAVEAVGEQASRLGIVLVTATVFVGMFATALAVWSTIFEIGLSGFAFSAGLAALASLSVHVAEQWEKVVVLRLGRFNRVAGPGLFFTVPIVESCAMRVDTRVRVTTFSAEETLTADLAPLYVDAVLFWMVWDAKAVCVEVSDFTRAVQLAAQTALRDAIGRGTAAEVAIRREQLDRELKIALDEKVGAWGITVLSVEVRDIVLPKKLQGVMSLEAQAEQRKKARVILAEAEQYIESVFESVGEGYSDNEDALRLRMMHLLYESMRTTGGTIVVPSSFSEGFSDVLPDSMKGTLGNK